MITLHHLNGTAFSLNSTLIETIESIPETKIITTTGKYFLVSESQQEITNLIVEFNRLVYGSQRIVCFEKTEEDQENCHFDEDDSNN